MHHVDLFHLWTLDRPPSDPAARSVQQQLGLSHADEDKNSASSVGSDRPARSNNNDSTGSNTSPTTSAVAATETKNNNNNQSRRAPAPRAVEGELPVEKQLAGESARPAIS